MKGVLFNALEEFIVEGKEDEVSYETILEKTKLSSDGVFIVAGNYPDSDFQALISASALHFNQTLDDFLRDFGQFYATWMLEKYPAFLLGHIHPKSFLLTLQNVITVEVTKLYTEAALPKFQFEDPAPDKLHIIYNSKRNLPSLVEGVLSGLGDFFEVQTSTETEHLAENSYLFKLSFDPPFND